MLPNLRLSGPGGAHLDSLGQLSLGAVSLTNSGLRSNQAYSNQQAWGALNKTLADYVKDEPWPTSAAASFSAAPGQPMPWAAAVKAPLEHQQQSNSTHPAPASNTSNQDCNNQHTTIGSWSSIDPSSSGRYAGWNSDNNGKSDGAFDDGTAIWGNPSTKKTGVDWADKMDSSPNNASQKNANSSQADKQRASKAEPTISSINGTEAWGAIINNNSTNSNSSNNNININNNHNQTNTTTINGSLRAHQPQQQPQQQQQQKSILNDISGNTYATKLMPGEMIKGDNKMTSWGETSSLQAANNAAATNGNSSPPNNSHSSTNLWNNLALSAGAVNNNKSLQQQKSSDWLSSLSSTSQSVSSIYGGTQNNTAAAVARFDELRKQLESTSIFDSVSSITTKNATNNKNSFLDQHQHQHQGHMAVGLGSIGSVVSGSGGDSINDLKQQMSANFNNDLTNSPTRQHHITSAIGNNQQQQQSQQMDPGAYSATAPSRDLLKQMVHQIQLAVQAGHLNAHILNQPMSTPTLQLVYQLLQQIKTLHPLQEIQQRSGMKTDIGSPTNLDIQINRIKQNISLLQKAISQQQAALTKNETISEQQNLKLQQQQSGDDASSYAGISKLSTIMKVPPNNVSTMINNINIDSFRGSSLIDSLKNSSDSLRSAQMTFDASVPIDKSVSSYIQAAASADNSLLGSSSGSNTTKATAQSSDFSKVQGFTTNNSNNISQLQSKGLLRAHSSSSSSSSSVAAAAAASGASSSSAWSAFSSGDNYSDSQQGWPSQSRISSNNISQDDMFSGLYWGDLAASTAAFQLGSDNDYPSKQQQRQQQQVGVPSDPIGASYSSSGVAGSTASVTATTTTVGGRPAPPPGLYYNFFF